MTFKPQGKVVSVTPGTLVNIPTVTGNASKLVCQPLPGNAGIVYIGTSALVASTLAGVIFQILKPDAAAVAPLPIYLFENQAGEGNPMDTTAFYLDAANAGDGVLWTWITM